MAGTLKIGLAQIDPTVGDVAGNLELIQAAHAKAAAAGCDLVVFSELVVSGYPPEDLVLKPIFLDAVEDAVMLLAADTLGKPALLVGVPWRVDGAGRNAALVLADGKLAAVVSKHHLPNYGVFDELRVFAPGPLPEPVEIMGVKLGIMVCEDMWRDGPAGVLKRKGADILVVINGSPFEAEKPDERISLARERVAETGLGLIYLNQVGGQDELVFDGSSFVLGPDGEMRTRLAAFAEDFLAVEFSGESDVLDCPRGPLAEAGNPIAAIYKAMVLGLRDYVNKNSFPGVLIGLSGGIDSALSALVAVDALGSERVHCVMMPSPYTSRDSLEDAAALAQALGIRLDSVAIDPAMAAFDGMLKDAFVGHDHDTTEENIQARSRGITLMALSNKFGSMVLSTGNKSEMSVGYATLYGDMCGGFSVLKDVYKTTVYTLSRWRNEEKPEGALGPDGAVMPERIITKAPSAELKPGQTDQDSLPPYDVLDDILHCLIEGDMAIAEIVARGHDRDLVMRVWRMVNIAEYKRRQAPPGVKITRRSFGRDRRYPITNSFTGVPVAGASSDDDA
ncbi:MAG: NAD+ synthase [Alphaproteobacteria bacterium]|nr:NAD+ synthase [Alphaproteobacteria bacterium]MCZ6740566.1 NAD+ synthase [Alphaproteobacteria bacterium]MCZ6814935.1 NAD+ synthase [Alphaproteobacteria bacterium]MCZ6848309.1 NAD+ synthase [Alphaproteobacteria bacterium]